MSRDARPLDGRTALVTGASRGIGRGVARVLAAQGAAVAVHYTGGNGGGETEASRTVQEIRDTGGNAFAVELDFVEHHPAELLELFEAGAREHVGRAGLDILVNNAAYSLPTPYAQTSAELFDRHLAVNLRAPFLLIQAAATVMSAGASIVNISSSTTRVHAPDQAAYTITKGGLNTLTWYLAKELATRGVRMNAVVVGVTRTELSQHILGDEGLDEMAEVSPLRRIGEVTDIADVVAFLASDAARWVVGEAIEATGGQTLT